ncbi:HipA domain-containing protein [Paraclostridium bifermentans]|uniref:hypothetical protein n=1 Tax=Paraclostridium bifermentans TaxID=1490 RepID=UPI00374F9982
MKYLDLFGDDKGIRHTLYNKNVKVLDFIRPINELEDIYLTEVYREDLLPYRIKYKPELIDTWLYDRAIPTNRDHIEKVLQAIGLNSYNHLDLLEVNNACSLNDTYWIKADKEYLDYHCQSFEDVSLYRGFKESLGIVTFFGGDSSLGGRLATPEVTSQGMLGKAWRVDDGRIKLFKAGTSGYANAGLEPYMEVISAKVADILNINHIDYKLDYWDNKVCCVSELFTSEDVGYLPMAEYLKAEVGEDRRWTYKLLEKILSNDFMDKINDMIVFDFIIENCDRHFNNFGFLINNNTREIIDIAPLFDHGMSLHWNKLPQYDLYNKMDTNKGTFEITNLKIALAIVQSNPRKYKHWAKELRLNIEILNDSIDNLKEISRRKWVKKLLVDRCEMIMNM